MQELQEMLAKGGKKLQDFVDDVWKKIADWFLKNKEKVEGVAKKIKDALSKDGKTEEFFRKIEKKFNLAGDEILSSSDIKKLRRLLLETFDVALEFVDQNPALKAKLKDWTARRVAGSFNMVEGVMYLRKSVTAYTVQHEMFHMKLWHKMTKEFPELQPLFQKTLGKENRLFHEEYVLAEFMKNPKKMRYFLLQIESFT
ncbi:zincin-like metallopeptidase toxin domain-containing protein [Epilithonimonas sp.]|uniref:zincin-like metallopeptidase toxin domain-containing protein n=1 Tax=Epilithonimonas sp. TaxID=2894511 RepID=UPI0035ADB488